MNSVMAFAVFLLCACDPAWTVSVELRDPSDRPVSGATVALACDDYTRSTNGFSVRTDGEGTARIGGMGSSLPEGCDLYVAKPGVAPLRIRYRELCPDNHRGCERVFDFALVVSPCSEPQGTCLRRL